MYRKRITMLICFCLAGFQLLASDDLTDFQKKQKQLLKKTDHQKIFQDCQPLMRSSIGMGMTGKTYSYGDPNYINELPKPNLALEPTFVHINEVLVSITFMGGMHHSGVIAYMDDNIEKDDDYCMMLVKGLFYYDDNITDAGPEYQEYPQSLKQEPLTYREWARKNMQNKDPNNTTP